MIDLNKDYKSLGGMVSDLDFDTTSWFIIIHNLMPVIGVLFFGFDAANIIFIYITETVIIGLLNVPKILLAQKNPNDNSASAPSGSIGGRIFIVLFFLVHYNMFNFGQITIILPMVSPADGLDAFIGYIIENEFMHYAVASIVITHGVSLWFDYIAPKAYKDASPVLMMFIPYPRIFVQQFVAIFGSFLLLAFGAPVMMLILLQFLKIAVEIFTHQVLKNASNRGMIFTPNKYD
ncbi:MAG: hypothetical protein IT279_13765 [Ignavibacteriaceae bacterium]|nr:hypothetical protein [Ignavibacteriaceae bacterium]